MTFSIITLNTFDTVMLSVNMHQLCHKKPIMLSFVMLSVVMLNVVMMSVLAASKATVDIAGVFY
jgi:hypothetical protein